MTRPDFEHNAELRGLLNSLSQGVAIFDNERRLLFINSAMGAVTGGHGGIGESLADLMKNHRLRTMDHKPLEPHQFPIELVFSEGEETRDEIYEYFDIEGQRRLLSVTCLKILDENGNFSMAMCSITDVTRRRTREDKLKFMVESAKILSITMDFKERMVKKATLAVPSLADWCAIDILKDDGTVERIAVIHQDPEQIRFIEAIERKYPSDPNAPGSVKQVILNNTPQFVPIVTDEMVKAAAKSPEHLNDILKLQLKSVMVIPISARGKGLGAMTVAYAESGRTYTEDDLRFFQEFCHHVGVLFDNGRLYDEIRRRDKAKDTFLASLSHELRNPLAPIKSSLELLKLRETPPDVREELTIIEHQFDHMAKLLNDLLDVTRFTSAKIQITPHTLELRKLVERALKSSDALLKTADITLHFAYPSAKIMVEADETRLEQAISNLMSNAIKFTPSGGSIWVEVEKNDKTAIIRVRDNGAGIEAADLPNIFEMYYQGGHTRQPINAGLGIGLLLVERIVKMHDGTVTAESAGTGKGSTFTITLPLSPAVAPKKNASVSAPASPSQKRILVVDDNEQAADSLVKLLSKLGADARAVYSGDEALALDRLDSYHVILLDIGMPKMDGYALVKELRRKGHTGTIVALTGYGMKEDKDRAIESGFSAHLTKPIGLKELREVFTI